jgi:hypothetical protein
VALGRRRLSGQSAKVEVPKCLAFCDVRSNTSIFVTLLDPAALAHPAGIAVQNSLAALASRFRPTGINKFESNGQRKIDEQIDVCQSMASTRK